MKIKYEFLFEFKVFGMLVMQTFIKPLSTEWLNRLSVLSFNSKLFHESVIGQMHCLRVYHKLFMLCRTFGYPFMIKGIL